MNPTPMTHKTNLPPRLPRLLILGCAAALCLGLLPGRVTAERIDILRGFLAEVPSSQPHRIDFAGNRYMIQAAGTPINRREVYDATILYVDQFPEGVELFRDDMDTFDRMVKRGGVLILLCGAEANAMTIENMNYLGKRFGFRFAQEPRPGEILPIRVGQGPLGGDVWLCEPGFRTLSQVDAEWAWHYRAVNDAVPVAISRHWGDGFILVMGTTEVNRTSQGRVFSALTLVDWARAAKLLPPPDPTPTPAPIGTTPSTQPHGTTPMPAGEIATPQGSNGGGSPAPTAGTPLPPVPTPESGSNLLAGRLAQMREALGVNDPSQPAGPRTLISPEKRAYFPPLVNARDLDDKIVELSDFRNKVTLVNFWATWYQPCMDAMPQLVALRRQHRDSGFDILGISLDKSVPSIRDAEQNLGMDWRQVCDGEGWNSQHVKVLNLKSIPQTYLLDRKGRICAQNLTGEALEKAITEALAEP